MTPEEITTLFATAATTFQPIVGQPTDDDLTAIREILYPLLLDIPYDMHGPHNLVGLIEPTTTYAATWGAAFVIPPRPPAYPAIPDDAAAGIRKRREAEHALLVRDHASYDAAERATAKFLREAVDEIWYRDLRHTISFYTTVKATTIMTHLNANCGGLHPSELVTLPTDMMGYYGQAEGIPEYINMLEDAQRKLARANLPMSDAQLLAIASTAILASGHFPRPTDEWEALTANAKTWAAWKTHYRAAHIARKRQMLAAGKTTSSFGGAAHVVTTIDEAISDVTLTRLDGYLDNLAAAATTERSTLTQLIENNATLTANVTSLTASVASLTSAYAILAAGRNNNNTGGTGGGTQQPRHSDRKPSYLAVDGYCWTHGYRVRKGHDSANCKDKATGHKDAATRAQTMGGSTSNKGWETT